MGEPHGLPTADAPDERLDDRIVRRIQAQSGHLSFNGLRRALGAHPESLSRALRRLERFGVLLHDESGYALAEGPGAESDGGVRPEFHRIGEVDLPAALPDSWVLGEFAGRWFRDLRWVGLVDGRRGPWLIWSLPGTDEHVFLSVDGRRLRVGTDRVAGVRTERAEAAARALLASSLERLGRRPILADRTTRFFRSLDRPATLRPN